MFSKEILNRKQRFIFDKDSKMMFEITPGWIDLDYDVNNELKPEKHNALIRTALAALAYKDEDLIEGVRNCFRKFTQINKKGYLYQACRCNPRLFEDDVSRDQVIMALSALFILDKPFAKEIASHLPYKLSRRFNQVPSMWFWVKWIADESKWNKFLFKSIFFIELVPAILISYIGKWLNIQEIMYPSFGVHLSAWQLYIMKDESILKKMLLFYQKSMDNNNLLVRKLLGDKVEEEEILNYEPTCSYRWDTFLGTSKRYVRNLNDEEKVANTIDKDIFDLFKK